MRNIKEIEWNDGLEGDLLLTKAIVTGWNISALKIFLFSLLF